ncbi:MAG: amidohydrolase family protein [Coriobacteriia bacterium]|nr:amidohydrolase family protein [Coriobacteriia bacterium]MBN2839957.1 amidohydrolase family protein [Coriobacteriia bacterium]
MLLLARYVLPVNSPYIEDGGVLVRGSRIMAVGLRSELLAAYPDEEVIDYGLAALMPGFVDLHTHLEYSVFRGIVDDLPYTRWKMEVQRREAFLSDEDWAASAALGAEEAIRSGITTIADVTYSGASLRAADSAGLRAVIYREVSTMDASRAEEEVAKALEDMRVWEASSDGERISIGIAPHGPYTCHPRLFKAVAEAIGASDTHVSLHLAGSKDEYDFVKYGSSQLGQDFRDQSGWADEVWMPTGVSPVRYVYQWGILDLPNVLAVHCVHVDAEDIAVLARADVAVAYCARCNAKLGMGTAPLGDFLQKGLRVGIGTDSPASNSTMDVFAEMRTGLLVQRSLRGEKGFFTAEEFIRLSTLDGARALKLDHEIGSLEEGKRADIIAVDLSHSYQVPTENPYGAVVHTSNQEDVLLTMVDGRILLDRGRFLTADSDGMRQHFQEIRAKIRG